MKYKNIIIFTKTLWSEAPRLRHQVTNLLLTNGHKVTYFEKTNLKSFKIQKYKKDEINFIRHYEFLHHQLKPFDFLIKFNQLIIKYFIKKSIQNIEIDLIINFNYDYDFLKELFPNKKIVTLINDDFVAQSKPWMKSAIRRQLKSTCEKSDVVFTVSYPIEKQIKSYNKNTHIFFPWAEQKYIAPVDIDIKRDIVLFWGYIDHRVEWNVIEYLLKKGIKFRFIGDIQEGIKEKVERFTKYDTFEIFPATPIEKITFDDICCSILPYDVNVKGVKAISISNRAFQLLSYGIPLLYSDLPALIDAPKEVISKCKKVTDYVTMIEYYKNHFYNTQQYIEDFLKLHYAETRYQSLLALEL